MKKPLRASALLLLAATFARPAAAQTRPTTPVVKPELGMEDTTQVTLEMLPDSLAAVPLEPGLDSAQLAWSRQPPQMRDFVCDRIACFETDVPHTFNNTVMAHVTYFTQNNRRYMQRVLERENLYFPLFEKYLAKYGLPQDLKYLAVVESALIPTAKSRVGALGLWQFMGGTANDLRLHRDEWIDERMNPDKATEAACKHLKWLYGMLHDWELVLAAYNWGPGNVQRVMKRTGKKNFWDMYPYMPQETRNYVPTFTAIMYSMKYAEHHQLRTPELNYQYAEPMDTLQLGGRAFDISRLSRACGLDSAALFRFNPELRKHYLPENYRPYTVQFPASARPVLQGVDRQTLFTYCRPAATLPQPLQALPPRLQGVEQFPSATLAAGGPGSQREEKPVVAAQEYKRKVHTVRRGQTVAELAEWYGVSQTQIRRWNNLSKGQALKSKQQVVIFIPQTDAAPAAAVAVAKPAAVPAAAVAPRTPAEMGVKMRKVPVAAPAPTSTTETSVAAAKVVGTASPLPPVEAAAPKAVAQAPASKSAAKSALVQPVTKAKEAVVAAAKAETADTAAAVAQTPTEYLVRKGDNLSKVAREQGVSVAQIIAWNNLANEPIMPGQRLRLMEPTEAAEPAASAKTVAAAVAIHKTLKTSSARKSLPVSQEQQRVHVVQPGDTLYNISRRYEGLTVEQLRKMNHLKSDDVKPGQKLIVAG